MRGDWEKGFAFAFPSFPSSAPTTKWENKSAWRRDGGDRGQRAMDGPRRRLR